MAGMHSCEWLKPFVGRVLLMTGAWLLQLGFEVADGAIRRSPISGLEPDEVSRRSDSSCGAAEPRLFPWSVGGTW